ncbi:Tuberin [Porphyridium purpureum]|uniref:Tuberin n=1 Tax=Porphyridium purpureum TaxID=35688 RepID=A0A5J4YSC2_PORPP|nr:Tuberin [Porphyridium purpureum]|eukprot:POR8224..scf229_5
MPVRQGLRAFLEAYHRRAARSHASPNAPPQRHASPLSFADLECECCAARARSHAQDGRVELSTRLAPDGECCSRVLLHVAACSLLEPKGATSRALHELLGAPPAPATDEIRSSSDLGRNQSGDASTHESHATQGMQVRAVGWELDFVLRSASKCSQKLQMVKQMLHFEAARQRGCHHDQNDEEQITQDQLNNAEDLCQVDACSHCATLSAQEQTVCRAVVVTFAEAVASFAVLHDRARLWSACADEHQYRSVIREALDHVTKAVYSISVECECDFECFSMRLLATVTLMLLGALVESVKSFHLLRKTKLFERYSISTGDFDAMQLARCLCAAKDKWSSLLLVSSRGTTTGTTVAGASADAAASAGAGAGAGAGMSSRTRSSSDTSGKHDSISLPRELEQPEIEAVEAVVSAITDMRSAPNAGEASVTPMVATVTITNHEVSVTVEHVVRESFHSPLRIPLFSSFVAIVGQFRAIPLESTSGNVDHNAATRAADEAKAVAFENELSWAALRFIGVALFGRVGQRIHAEYDIDINADVGAGLLKILNETNKMAASARAAYGRLVHEVSALTARLMNRTRTHLILSHSPWSPLIELVAVLGKMQDIDRRAIMPAILELASVYLGEPLSKMQDPAFRIVSVDGYNASHSASSGGGGGGASAVPDSFFLIPRERVSTVLGELHALFPPQIVIALADLKFRDVEPWRGVRSYCDVLRTIVIRLFIGDSRVQVRRHALQMLRDAMWTYYGIYDDLLVSDVFMPLLEQLQSQLEIKPRAHRRSVPQVDARRKDILALLRDVCSNLTISESHLKTLLSYLDAVNTNADSASDSPLPNEVDVETEDPSDSEVSDRGTVSAEITIDASLSSINSKKVVRLARNVSSHSSSANDSNSAGESVSDGSSSHTPNKPTVESTELSLHVLAAHATLFIFCKQMMSSANSKALLAFRSALTTHLHFMGDADARALVLNWLTWLRVDPATRNIRFAKIESDPLSTMASLSDRDKPPVTFSTPFVFASLEDERAGATTTTGTAEQGNPGAPMDRDATGVAAVSSDSQSVTGTANMIAIPVQLAISNILIRIKQETDPSVFLRACDCLTALLRDPLLVSRCDLRSLLITIRDDVKRHFDGSGQHLPLKDVGPMGDILSEKNGETHGRIIWWTESRLGARSGLQLLRMLYGYRDHVYESDLFSVVHLISKDSETMFAQADEFHFFSRYLHTCALNVSVSSSVNIRELGVATLMTVIFKLLDERQAQAQIRDAGAKELNALLESFLIPAVEAILTCESGGFLSRPNLVHGSPQLEDIQRRGLEEHDYRASSVHSHLSDEDDLTMPPLTGRNSKMTDEEGAARELAETRHASTAGEESGHHQKDDRVHDPAEETYASDDIVCMYGDILSSGEQAQHANLVKATCWMAESALLVGRAIAQLFPARVALNLTSIGLEPDSALSCIARWFALGFSAFIALAAQVDTALASPARSRRLLLRVLHNATNSTRTKSFHYRTGPVPEKEPVACGLLFEAMVEYASSYGSLTGHARQLFLEQHPPPPQVPHPLPHGLERDKTDSGPATSTSNNSVLSSLLPSEKVWILQGTEQLLTVISATRGTNKNAKENVDTYTFRRTTGNARLVVGPYLMHRLLQTPRFAQRTLRARSGDCFRDDQLVVCDDMEMSAIAGVGVRSVGHMDSGKSKGEGMLGRTRSDSVLWVRAAVSGCRGDDPGGIAKGEEEHEKTEEGCASARTVSFGSISSSQEHDDTEPAPEPKPLDLARGSGGRNEQQSQETAHHYRSHLPYVLNPENRFHLAALLGQRVVPDRGAQAVSSSVSEEELRRSLSVLDRTVPDFMSRVGVVLIADEKESEAEILSRRTMSAHFSVFLRGLGSFVRLSKALQGDMYSGGLDTSGRYIDGEFMLRWLAPGFQVVFHVTTLMPNNEKSGGARWKKRHIGNDHVNIVWVDYGELEVAVDSLLLSKFNSVHIIVAPLRPRYLRVQVKVNRPEHVRGELIGPLVSGRVYVFLDSEIQQLAHLVRQTAIHANAACLRSMPHWYERYSGLVRFSSLSQPPPLPPPQE